MNRLTAFFSTAAVVAALLPLQAKERPDIPERPEKLVFPPLVYEPPLPADYRVPLESGPVAYVVPDRELPLVNIVIYLRVGAFVEPAGKGALAETAGYLLARGGTQQRTAEELEERLAFLAAPLQSGVGDTFGSVSLNLLSKDLDEGLAILREVLIEPRFQEDRFELRRQQLLQEMARRNDEAADIERRERSFLVYGEDFWVNRFPTAESVKSLTRDDLRAFHKRWIHPANFVVAVNGDFDRDRMVARLEKLFSDWPFKGEPAPEVPTQFEFTKPGIYIVDKDVNQGRVSVVLPGVTRDNPDYSAIMVMNRILGGGGFTSRIVNRVRSDEGLAYAAGSSFQGGVYYPLPFIASFQTKSRTVAYATSLVIEEIKRMILEPVSEEEIETAKQSFIETFPRMFSTKAQVANTFAMDELTGRYAKEPDYWKTFRSKIKAVTLEEVQRVAKRYLKPSEIVILAVGQKSDILLGHPNHPVTLQSLLGQEVMELPLRDPLTLQPVQK